MHENTRKYDQLVLTTNGQVLESYAQLHARKAICTKANFELWEKATGWTYSPLALMLGDQLKAMKLLQPCSQFTHDYMHGVLQGTGPIALFHFLCAMDTELQVWQFLEGYFKHWTFPKQWKSQHVGTYFSKKKMVSHKNNQKCSCQASELLAIFPVVRHFVHAVCMPRGLCLPASQAFLAMAAVIDQVHDGNQAGVISRNTLLPAIETSIEGFHTAFPAIPLIKNGIGNCTCQMPMPDLENYQVALPMRESTSPLVPWQLCCTTRKILKETCWSRFWHKKYAPWTHQICSKMVCS